MPQMSIPFFIIGHTQCISIHKMYMIACFKAVKKEQGLHERYVADSLAVNGVLMALTPLGSNFYHELIYENGAQPKLVVKVCKQL